MHADRSYYLDDMNLAHGDAVVVKSFIGSMHLTEGREYTPVWKDCGCSRLVVGIVNDEGRWVVPSARFQRVAAQPVDDCSHWIGKMT